jgi:hypothetical protein
VVSESQTAVLTIPTGMLPFLSISTFHHDIASLNQDTYLLARIPAPGVAAIKNDLECLGGLAATISIYGFQHLCGDASTCSRDRASSRVKLAYYL